jgi:rod shape-determining protein MreC
MAANADIQMNDRLVTSGIDGTYPAGLPVATVIRIERDAENAYARVVCRPAAGVDRGRFVLVLSDDTAKPPRPEETQTAKDKTRRRLRDRETPLNSRDKDGTVR